MTHTYPIEKCRRLKIYIYYKGVRRSLRIMAWEFILILHCVGIRKMSINGLCPFFLFCWLGKVEFELRAWGVRDDNKISSSFHGASFQGNGTLFSLAERRLILRLFKISQRGSSRGCQQNKVSFLPVLDHVSLLLYQASEHRWSCWCSDGGSSHDGFHVLDRYSGSL